MYYIIRYNYVGNEFDEDYHTDDWANINTYSRKEALKQFWNNVKDSGGYPRAMHRKDYKIFEILEFETYDACSRWRKNWWTNEPEFLGDYFV